MVKHHDCVVLPLGWEILCLNLEVCFGRSDGITGILVPISWTLSGTTLPIFISVIFHKESVILVQ